MASTSVWRKGARLKPKPPEAENEFFDYTISILNTDPETGEQFYENLAGWTYQESALGYYEDPDNPGEFIPVHLPTGIELTDTPMALENCQAFLRDLAGRHDWHSVGEDGPPAKVITAMLTAKNKYKNAGTSAAKQQVKK